MQRLLACGLVVALVGLAPAKVSAGQTSLSARSDQAGVNDGSRWLPWLGCWRPSDERSPEEGVRVCVVPAGANGARIMTLAGDQTVIEETFVANGTSQAVIESGCRGTRTSDWSKGGQRLFTTAELACEGQPARKVSGLSFIAAGGDWVDIQAVTTGARETVRVRRYRRSGEQPPDPALLPADLAARAARSLDGTRVSPFTLDDVIETSGKISSAAVEAAVVETQATFPLNGRALIALGDAGVAGNVIDLMVAQTFPKQFQVRRRSGGSSSTSWADYGGVGWDWFGYDPYYTYYSPFGYSYWDRFGDYYYGPGTGVIIPGSGGNGAAASSDSHGRVLNGGGYTQVLPREQAVTPRASASGDGVSGASGGSFSGGTPSGDSSGVSSGGYSSGGGGGGDGGRSAVPR